jgi:NAD(P)-dependent dehydrogenase (short-subunit alcohol dehydrogenase family)
LFIELHSKAYTNHQNYIVKCNQGAETLQHYHVMYVTEAFKKTHTTFKALDIVINNAGILSNSQWEAVIAVNLVKYTKLKI